MRGQGEGRGCPGGAAPAFFAVGEGGAAVKISVDERERAVFRSRRMYQTDLQSNLATAEDRGERRGERIGERKGKAMRSMEIARNLLGMNLPLEQIASATGLTREEIEGLRIDGCAQYG